MGGVARRRIAAAVSLGVLLLTLAGAHADPGPPPDAPPAGDRAPLGDRPPTWWDEAWETIVGRKARDALLLGLWSLHLDGTGEYLGDGRNNDQGELIGVQLFGVTAGTFMNSHDDRTFFAGFAREVYSAEPAPDWRVDLGYKLGLMVGYGDELVNVGGVSPFAILVGGLSWKRLGFDLGFVPTGILTLNFRLDIDGLLPW